MSPAKSIHSVLQWPIQRMIYDLIGKNGEIIPECPIQTIDNVKVADVVWISPERYSQVKAEAVYSKAPEVCIEIVSASNSKAELLAKKSLYLLAGSEDVWICFEAGEISFYDGSGGMERSRLIAEMPGRVDIS
jgi:Uma2 family endonuclease